MSIQEIVENQRNFFATQKTKELAFRKVQLKRLQTLIRQNEKQMTDAIQKDFGKSDFETSLTELGLLYQEIDFFLKNLNRLAKPKRVKTNLVNLPGSSRIFFEPYGNCLVIGAWNYPYLLTLGPVIAAITAGNTVILKPSEISVETSQMLTKLINENFPVEYLCVIEGGAGETTEILKQKFDKIFYTGSTAIGKIVYEAAAKQLTPVTLELGGKSPAIVTKSANLKVAAKRIVWGKFLNAGQTCVAPDYLLVHSDIKDEFVALLKRQIDVNAYKDGSEHYTQIVNDRNFERIVNLIDPNKLVAGGKFNPKTRFIEPTLMDNVNWKDEIMKQEIFGPILPVLTFTNFNQIINEMSCHEKPLSGYLFSNDSSEQKIFSENFSFGGGCINDVVIHLSNPNLPFGGVGNSGFGNYHGKYGFETFSHQKSILKKANWGEPKLKYPPYSDSKLKWIKSLF